MYFFLRSKFDVIRCPGEILVFNHGFRKGVIAEHFQNRALNISTFFKLKFENAVS